MTQAQKKDVVDLMVLAYGTPTDRQREVVEAVNKAGSIGAGARALGLDHKTVREYIELVKKKARAKGWVENENEQDAEADGDEAVIEARRGHAPGHFDSGVAPGYLMGKVTVQRSKDGEIERTWERQSPDAARTEAALREAVAALASPLEGLGPVVAGPKRVNSDLMAIIPVGDPHNGLYVWAEECGEDFDSDIARKLALAASDRLITSAPACDTGILLLLGDVLHANDQTNQTPAHKHQLDVDTRFVRVLGISIQTYRHMILRMKQRFSKVVVKLIPGNHDPQAIWTLAFALQAYFARDPGIEVDLGPSKFWYYQFGKVLIGSTHGDTVKPERLPSIMAADRPKEWGDTSFRYWYTGHIHSKNAIEFPGVQWESFRTLAATDSYAHSHGYRAGRDMVLIVHHREYGEVERHRCDAGMVEAKNN